MYLIERLFGVIIYSVLLLVAYAAIIKTTVPVKFVLKLYTFILALMGFFYIPPETADLYAIYEFVRTFSAHEFLSFFETYMKGSSTAVSRLLYWAIGKTGEPRLLPFITCIIVYSCIFYIIYHTAKKYRYSRKTIAYSLLFIMSVGNYAMVISNIRMMIAISLIAFCFFRETVEKKINVFHFILYVIAALMHNAALLFVVIRVLFLICTLLISRNVYHCFLGLSVFAVCFILLIFTFENITDEVIETVTFYLTESSYSYFWEYLISTISLLLMAYAIVFLRHTQGIRREYMQIYNMTVFLCFLAVVFCYVFSIYFRFLVLIAPIVFVPMLMTCIEGSVSVPKRYTILFNNIFIILCCTLWLLNCARGSLSSLKFFVLS